MKNLEDEIDELNTLDKARLVVIELKSKGRNDLDHIADKWDKSDDDIRYLSCVIKALCDQQSNPPSALVDQLENLSAEKIFNGGKDIPILWAARSMQALTAAPDSAFSKALLIFYYQIIRELYTADSPDWQVGGARADVGGSASAYVTGECVRAILGFARTLTNTSDFVREVVVLRKRQAALEALSQAPIWREIEGDRLRRDFYTTVVRLLGNIALKLDGPDDPVRLLPLTPDKVDRFIQEVPHNIARAVSTTAETFRVVIEEVEQFRAKESREACGPSEAPEKVDTAGKPNVAQKRFHRSESAHMLAINALRQGGIAATNASNHFSLGGPGDLNKGLVELADMLEDIAKDVRTLTFPARFFFSSVLDKELAASSSEARPHVDAAEMVFAATSYGFASGDFEDHRLQRAAIYLSQQLSERGRFRSGRPFHIDSNGSSFEVLAAEVLRAFAQLLENVDSAPVDEELVERMIRFFNDTRRPFRNTPRDGTRYFGWCSDKEQEPAGAQEWISAISVLALERMKRMLDARINAQVLRHFSVRPGKSCANPLRDLFYPDYGLRNKSCVPAVEGSWRKEESVALVLERLRTHVLGQSWREKAASPLYSLILFGPPGTGKTTLVEALANSADVPFVEVTPSDIVSSGADVVERRARAVFTALALLTRVVILFDEFDPVLKQRKTGGRENTVFSFVTPGMLPKLKHLHQQAKRRQVAYVLITNWIGVLDDAAIREGRFDCKLGIYPPDPLSRQGRLLDTVLTITREDEDFKAPPDLGDRVLEVVGKTSGGQMESLTKTGWFSSRKHKEAAKESPVSYLTGRCELNDIHWPDPGPKPRPLEKVSGLGSTEPYQLARREYEQRAWISEWDEKLKEPMAIASDLPKPPTVVPQIK